MISRLPTTARDLLVAALLLFGLLARGMPAPVAAPSPPAGGEPSVEAVWSALAGAPDEGHDCGCASAAMCAGGCCCDPDGGSAPVDDRGEGPYFSGGCGGSPWDLPAALDVALGLLVREAWALPPPPGVPVWDGVRKPSSRRVAPAAPPPETGRA